MINLPVEQLICRLKRPHSNNHLTAKQKEVNFNIQRNAKRYVDKCIEKLQPFYSQGSLTADNFFISGQLLPGKKFNGPLQRVPERKYDFMYLQPDVDAARTDLVLQALMPWIRLLTVAFEVLENCDIVLSHYLAHAAAAVTKLEAAESAGGSLLASKNGRKKRPREHSELNKKIVELYKKGMRQNAIAIELNTSESKVSRTLNKKSKLNIARSLDVKPQ